MKTLDIECGYDKENVNKRWLTTGWIFQTGNNFFVCNVHILIRKWTTRSFFYKKQFYKQRQAEIDKKLSKS